jgi:hypothetical protein
MKTSELFSSVMSVLWDGAENPPKEAVAIASYIKTHRVNAENALEVLHIMWPSAKLQVRPDGEGVPAGSIWFDVQFEDGSQVMVDAEDGIGNSIEVLS